jgi:hypothetical protein
VFLSVFFGDTVAGAVSASLRALAPSIFVCMGAWFVWLWFACRHRRWEMAAACYLTVASIALSLVRRNLLGYYLSFYGVAMFNAPRYFQIALGVVLLLAGFTVERLMGSRRDIAQAACLLVLFTGGVAGNFRVPPYEDLNWTKNAALLEEQMRRGPNQAGTLIVPIIPPPLVCPLP